jgi:hypothetical protein
MYSAIITGSWDPRTSAAQPSSQQLPERVEFPLPYTQVTQCAQDGHPRADAREPCQCPPLMCSLCGGLFRARLQGLVLHQWRGGVKKSDLVLKNR